MRVAVALALVVLALTPGVVAGSTCLPLLLGRACVSPIVSTSVLGGDVFVSFTPLVAPREWRSAHFVAGPNGAGAAVHGAGPATGGPLDAWASVSGTSPQAGVYACFHYPPALHGQCSSLLQRVTGMVPPLPATPTVPLAP